MSGPRGTTGELEIGGGPTSPDQRTVGGVQNAPADERTDSNAFAIGAIILGVLAVFFLPIVLGPIGIALAVMARNRGQSLATVALWVAIGGTVAGLTFGVLALTMTEGEVAGAALRGVA